MYLASRIERHALKAPVVAEIGVSIERLWLSGCPSNGRHTGEGLSWCLFCGRLHVGWGSDCWPQVAASCAQHVPCLGAFLRLSVFSGGFRYCICLFLDMVLVRVDTFSGRLRPLLVPCLSFGCLRGWCGAIHIVRVDLTCSGCHCAEDVISGVCHLWPSLHSNVSQKGDK